MTNSPTVLIVGAGPVGLTMAAFLTHYGIPCRIIDKKSGPTQTSNAVGVHARTLELLAEIGLTDAFIASGRKIESVQFFVHQRPMIHLDLGFIESPYHFVTDIPQCATEQHLLDYLQQHQLSVEWNTTLRHATQTPQTVTVEIEKDQQTHTQQFDWLIACDGFHSTAREATNIRYEGTEFQYKFIMIDAPIQSERALNAMYGAKTPDVSLFVFPMLKTARIIAEIGASSEFTNAEPSQGNFQKMLDSALSFKITVGQPLWQSHFYVHERLASHYRAGRMFVAGDAAHAHIPVAGQGMNTGMQDAINLAWKLALVIQGNASEKLLNTYETERRPVAQDVLTLTTRMGRSFLIRNQWLSALLMTVVRFISRTKGVQRKITNTIAELRIQYPSSEIVRGHARKKLAPGKRYPFALPEALNGQFLVLDFSGDLTLESEIATLKVMKNTTALKGIDSGYCIIRPDRYIGYVGQDKKAVTAYLQSIR